MEKLFTLFNQIAELSPALQEAIANTLKRREVRKKEIILREGQVPQSIYYIDFGLIRSYHFDKNKEITSWLMRENDIFMSILSFVPQIPSFETIQALEDSVLYGISYVQFVDLFQRFPEFYRHRAMITDFYYRESEYRHLMREKAAYDRYLYLLEKHPDLLGRVQDRYLASYLGVTNSTFSVQRGKYARAMKNKKA